MDEIYKVYKIENTLNGKKYIGYTKKSVEKRFDEHNSPHSECRYLSNALRKYGRNNFTLTWIASSKDLISIGFLEAYFIDYYNSLVPNGYNLKTGGHNPTVSEETKALMSESMRVHWDGMTKEERDFSLRGAMRYVENKKTPVVGVNLTSGLVSRYTSTLEARSAGYFIDAVLAEETKYAGDSTWFYDEGLSDAEYVSKAIERCGPLGTYSKGRNSWEVCDKSARVEAIRAASEDRMRPVVGVCRFDLKLVQFNSIADAERLGGFNRTNIHQTLSGENKHHNNYCWFYREPGLTEQDYIEKAKKKLGALCDPTNMEPVIAINKKKGTVIRYNTLYEAEAAGFEIKAIRRVLRGERPGHGGCFWKKPIEFNT